MLTGADLSYQCWGLVGNIWGPDTSMDVYGEFDSPDLVLSLWRWPTPSPGVKTIQVPKSNRCPPRELSPFLSWLPISAWG